MEDKKLQRLKEVLSIPTYSRNEELMIEYLEQVLTDKGFNYTKDKIGNIYVTKGKAEFYPCFVAHTDTVHYVNHNLKVVQLEENGKTILTGIDAKTMKPSGIGGDDKCGVFLCLEMLDTLDNVKVALFVSEEIGCVGSREADPEFFKNVGYAIQYDSPKGNSMSLTLMGKKLFGEKSDFGQKVSPLILEHGINSWERHPYTDIWPLMEKFGFSCLNLAAGYHRYHTDNEYVVVEEVDNAFELGLKLHSILGENFYERIEEPTPTYTNNWFNNRNNKQVLVEDIEAVIVEENNDDLFFEEDDDVEFSSYHYADDEEFSDLWDYDDFNVG
jgi:tripeptide aminopeptidase